jgi:hypothetical protein
MESNNGNGEEHAVGHFACEKHLAEGIAVSYTSAHCPLCTVMTKSDAIAVAATQIGLVLVKMNLAGIPFALAMPDALRTVGELASGEIGAALNAMHEAMGSQRSPLTVARPSLVVPPRR